MDLVPASALQINIPAAAAMVAVSGALQTVAIKRGIQTYSQYFTGFPDFSMATDNGASTVSVVKACLSIPGSKPIPPTSCMLSMA